jgi:hypothetical protein
VAAQLARAGSAFSCTLLLPRFRFAAVSAQSDSEFVAPGTNSFGATSLVSVMQNEVLVGSPWSLASVLPFAVLADDIRVDFAGLAVGAADPTSWADNCEDFLARGPPNHQIRDGPVAVSAVRWI